MAKTTPSPESVHIADRALIEALLGMLRMAAEEGSPSAVKVRCRAGDDTWDTPYGLYRDETPEELLLYIGRPDQETLSVSKRDIVDLRLIRPEEFVAALNSLAPKVDSLTRMSESLLVYLSESYRQWKHVIAILERNSPWTRPRIY